jgi:hypothetical protein
VTTVGGALASSPVSYEHLVRLTDRGGLYEHARFTEPRPEHGYCVDDIARGLIVVTREPAPTQQLQDLANLYLGLVIDAQVPDGRFHNRRSVARRWTDRPSLEDCWGRAVWALGTAAARLPAGSDAAGQALAHFETSAHRRSPWLHAMAFAALGAAEVLARYPDHAQARQLLAEAAGRITVRPGRWPWPEDRLRYANGSLPETLLAAGHLLADPPTLTTGLAMLEWLLGVETAGDHLSVTPVGGWATGEPRPGFDQQPIEVATLADACLRAYEITGADRFRSALLHCEAWFRGANDSGVSMVDELTGGGYDGLERRGRNENQGAESTMAVISTFQITHRLKTATAI